VTKIIMFKGVDIVAINTISTSINSYKEIQTDNYIIIYIPQFNLAILIVKALILYNDYSPLQNAYSLFLENNTSLETNFETIMIEDIHDYHGTFYGDSIDIYTVDANDPLLPSLYNLLFTRNENEEEFDIYRKIKSNMFRNIILGNI